MLEGYLGVMGQANLAKDPTEQRVGERYTASGQAKSCDRWRCRLGMHPFLLCVRVRSGARINVAHSLLLRANYTNYTH